MIRKMGGWVTSDERFFEVESDAEAYEARYLFNKYYNDGYLGTRSLEGVGAGQMTAWLEEHSMTVREFLNAVDAP